MSTKNWLNKEKQIEVEIVRDLKDEVIEFLISSYPNNTIGDFIWLLKKTIDELSDIKEKQSILIGHKTDDFVEEKWQEIKGDKLFRLTQTESEKTKLSIKLNKLKGHYG